MGTRFVGTHTRARANAGKLDGQHNMALDACRLLCVAKHATHTEGKSTWAQRAHEEHCVSTSCPMYSTCGEGAGVVLWGAWLVCSRTPSPPPPPSSNPANQPHVNRFFQTTMKEPCAMIRDIMWCECNANILALRNSITKKETQSIVCIEPTAMLVFFKRCSWFVPPTIGVACLQVLCLSLPLASGHTHHQA